MRLNLNTLIESESESEEEPEQLDETITSFQQKPLDLQSPISNSQSTIENVDITPKPAETQPKKVSPLQSLNNNFQSSKNAELDKINKIKNTIKRKRRENDDEAPVCSYPLRNRLNSQIQ